MKVVGLFIEPRKLKQIYYNIDNFFDVLPDCKLYFYCGKGLLQHYDKLKQKYKLLIIRELNTYNLDALTYSDFMKTRSLWESLDGDFCLTIQTDGCLCKNSDYKIEEFFKYDYIGSNSYLKYKFLYFFQYYKKEFYNGGFSLRNISSMIKIIDKFKVEKTKKKPINLCNYPEDLYFYTCAKKFNMIIGSKYDFVSKNFCIQTDSISNNKIFCIHKYYHDNRIDKILEYCDEFKYFLKPIFENNSYIITNREIKEMKNYVFYAYLIRNIILIIKYVSYLIILYFMYLII